MKFPDPNIGYIFDYRSCITDKGILITFLSRSVKICFKYDNVEYVRRDIYRGGKISWDVIRWGKCPPGKEALQVTLRKSAFKNHLVVFDDLDAALRELKNIGIRIE